VQQAVLDNGREGFLLDGGGTELNAAEDAGVEDVDTGVDAVADELDGLFDEAVDHGGMAGLVHDNTVLGRLLDLSHYNCALTAMLLVEVGELLEGVVAGNVGVEHEKGRIVLAQDAFGELERAGGPEGFGLDRELDFDVVLLLILQGRVSGISTKAIGLVLVTTHCLEGRSHDLWAVVDSENNIGDTS
jgi:hypothetical protein